MLIGIEAAHANKQPRTGVEQVCFKLIQELKKIIPSEARVVLYSNIPLRNGLEVLPPNWSAKILSWPLNKLWSQLRLSWELWRQPPDIFIAPGQLVPFFCPRKTVVIVHDSAFAVHPEAYNFWGRQYLKWMNQRIASKAGLIITPSEFSRQELNKYFGVDLKKIIVAALGYEAEDFHLLADDEKSSGQAVLRKYKIDKPFLLAINRLETKKNTRRMVGAFNLLKKDFDLQLVLGGRPGVGYEEIKKEIEQSPYRADIKELGWVDKDDSLRLLNHARLFLLPSLYEGFGLPLLEAAACGCPVVAAQGGSLPEVGAGAVVYVDPLESADIARGAGEILSDDQQREQYRERGLELVKKYSWAGFAHEVWKSIGRLP